MRRTRAVSALALVVAACLPSTADANAPTQLSGNGSINTLPAWDGAQQVIPFGCRDTTTYGQVITMPGAQTRINKFTFEMGSFSGAGSMIVRGEIYAWDGRRATGSAVFETPPREIDYSQEGFHEETFNARGVTVQRGAEYVVFATLDRDYEECTGNYSLSWGSVENSAYGGGVFVYQNNAGDESQWTTTSWDSLGIDLAFKVKLK